MLFASATEPSRNSIANLDYSEDPGRPRVRFENRSSTASYVQDNVLAPASSLEYKIRLLKINKHQFRKYLRES